MGAVLVIVVIGSVVAYFIVSGVATASHDAHYPRERRVLIVQKLGEELGWWSYRDMFGLHPSDDWLPPVHEDAAVMKLSELLAPTTAREVRRLHKTEELLGG